jgi:hypothetical protein
MFTIPFVYTDLLSGSSATNTNVVVELWRSFTNITTDGIATEHNTVIATKSFTASNAVNSNLSFTEEPSFSDPGSWIILTARIEGTSGFWFKSGRLQSIPLQGAANPQGNMNVFVLPAQTVNNTNLTLPSLPSSFATNSIADLFSNGAITALTATFNSNGNIVIGLAGRLTPKLPGPVVTFTNTYTFRLLPNTQPHETTRWLILSLVSETGLTWSVGSVSGRVLDVVMAALLHFVNIDVANAVTTDIQQRINRQIITMLNTQLAANCAGVTTLPPGVLLHISHIRYNNGSNDLEISLSSFGNVLTRVCPQQSGSGRPGCTGLILLMILVVAGGIAFYCLG